MILLFLTLETDQPLGLPSRTYAGLKFSKNLPNVFLMYPIPLVVWDCKNTSNFVTRKKKMKKKSKKMKVFSNILKDNKIIFKKNERPISTLKSPVFRCLLYILIGVASGRSVMV
jgi:hypothetical protein